MSATPPPRRSQLRIVHSSSFAVQSVFGTALSNGALDTPFNLLDNPSLKLVVKRDEIIDCSNNWPMSRIKLSRLIRLSFNFEVTKTVLAGLLYWTYGVQSGSARRVLPVDEFQPPFTSLMYGHAGDDGIFLKLKDMVVNSLTLSGRATERLRGSIEFVGHGAPSVESYTTPACVEPVPIRMSDCLVTLDGDTIKPRSIEHTYQNNLLTDDDPFPSDDIDIQWMRRADRRATSFDLTDFGQKGDAIWLKAFDEEEVPFSWRLGSGSGNVTLDVANGSLVTVDDENYTGEAPSSVNDLQVLPLLVSGNANTPVVGTVAA